MAKPYQGQSLKPQANARPQGKARSNAKAQPKAQSQSWATTLGKIAFCYAVQGQTEPR